MYTKERKKRDVRGRQGFSEAPYLFFMVKKNRKADLSKIAAFGRLYR